jgi:ribosomal protein S27E
MSERIRCKYCNSNNIVKWQSPNRFKCKNCGRTFLINTAINGEIITKISEGLTKLEVNLKTNEDRIRLVPIGDIHVGAPKGQCDWAKVKRELDYILNTPNTYMYGMGDYMDCAQKMVGGHGGPNLFQSSLSPMEQYNVIEDAFKPLAKEGKIIGLHAGNHEDWIMQQNGIQIIDLLCRSLNVPFLGPGCDTTLTVNKQKYSIYSQHGSSNARLKYTKLGALINATRDIFSEIFLYGHVHQLGVQKGGKRLGNSQMKTYYILTGHFLNWEGSYAQAFGLDVCPSGCAQIKLFADRKDIHVSI